MESDIRIPLWILQSIISDLVENPNKDSWIFTTFAGNTLAVKRVRGPHSVVGAGPVGDTHDYGPPFDSLDFTYDPGD